VTDPVDMIVPLLREMRSENSALHEQTRELIKALDKRLGAVEEAQGSYRQALTADTLLSKLVTGEFEERIEALERKVRELERQK
jgi:polyhydroxyalkanoate synthesis regulator phasin